MSFFEIDAADFQETAAIAAPPTSGSETVDLPGTADAVELLVSGTRVGNSQGLNVAGFDTAGQSLGGGEFFGLVDRSIYLFGSENLGSVELDLSGTGTATVQVVAIGSAVPEPGSALLLGIGLVASYLVWKTLAAPA